jgi:hypothetical protein
MLEAPVFPFWACPNYKFVNYFLNCNLQDKPKPKAHYFSKETYVGAAGAAVPAASVAALDSLGFLPCHIFVLLCRLAVNFRCRL